MCVSDEQLYHIFYLYTCILISSLFLNNRQKVLINFMLRSSLVRTVRQKLEIHYRNTLAVTILQAKPQVFILIVILVLYIYPRHFVLLSKPKQNVKMVP